MEREEGSSEGRCWRGPRNGGRFSWFFLCLMPSCLTPALGLRLRWGPRAPAETAPPDHCCPSLLPRHMASDPDEALAVPPAGRLGHSPPWGTCSSPLRLQGHPLAAGAVNFTCGMLDVYASL